MSNENIKVVREPNSDEVSLEVRPGTIEAHVVGLAAQEALYRGEFDDQEEFAIRGPLLTLGWASNRARHGERTQPIKLRGVATTAVLNGLVALEFGAEEARAHLEDEHITSVQRSAFAPAVEAAEERAQQAWFVQAELLRQGAPMEDMRQTLSPEPRV